MSHEVAGPAGRTVVLLHAGVADRRMWEPQWAALTERFRTVRADLRGFGETPMPPGEFSYVDDVVELVAALGGGPVALVGSSFGGRVALETAAAHPSLVDRLILLAAAAGGHDPDPALREFGAAEDELLEADDIDGAVELNVRTWVQPEVSAELADLVRVMQRRAFDVQLAADKAEDSPSLTWPSADPAAITARTLVVSGERDFAHFNEIATHLAGVIPAARHVHLPWAGHLPSLERPEEITELLLDVLG